MRKFSFLAFLFAIPTVGFAQTVHIKIWDADKDGGRLVVDEKAEVDLAQFQQGDADKVWREIKLEGRSLQFKIKTEVSPSGDSASGDFLSISVDEAERKFEEGNIHSSALILPSLKDLDRMHVDFQTCDGRYYGGLEISKPEETSVTGQLEPKPAIPQESHESSKEAAPGATSSSRSAE